MITEKEELNLKMYALRILSSITKKLHLYIEVDINRSKKKESVSVEEMKEEDDNQTTMNESSISSGLEKSLLQ